MVDIEGIYFMKTKTMENKSYVDLICDVSEALNHMDWDYLRDVMVKMGFNSRMIH